MKPNIETYDRILDFLPSMETGIKVGFVLCATVYLVIVLAPFWTKYVAILEKRHRKLTRSRD
jgi:hypothetical protein